MNMKQTYSTNVSDRTGITTVAPTIHSTVRESMMNTLIRKFYAATTAGSVMSLAMAVMFAMTPMSDAMAKDKKKGNGNSSVTVKGTGMSEYHAWGVWRTNADNKCGGFSKYDLLSYKTYSNGNRTSWTMEAQIRCR